MKKGYFYQNFYMIFHFLLFFLLTVFSFTGICGERDVFLVWDKILGGKNPDCIHSIIQTADGNYVLAARTDSYGGGNGDFWVLKMDNEGNILWDKTFGGKLNDLPYSVIQANDGGYVIAGETYSFGFGAGSADVWLIKLDNEGNMLWDKVYGGIEKDSAYSIIQNSNGEILVAGETFSSDEGRRNGWLLRLDSDGSLVWDQTFGGSQYDGFNDIIQAEDGNYIIVGYTESFSMGGTDLWIIKLDNDGNLIWDKTFGGNQYDRANSVIQNKDGGYVIAGGSQSFGSGKEDCWVLKLNKDGEMLWEQTFGGDDWDMATDIIQTADGAYVLTGITMSYGAGGKDFWLIKLDEDGNLIWDKTFGEKNDDSAWSIIQANDGDLIIAGGTSLDGSVRDDCWIIKLSENKRKGDISISSNPTDAKIYLDNKEQGTTPIVVSDIDPDFYTLKITRTGYEDWISKINVFADQTTAISADLEQIAADIKLTGIPERASIYLDGDFVYTGSIIKNVPYGQHEIKVAKLLYFTQVREIDVVSSEKITMDIHLPSYHLPLYFGLALIIYLLFNFYKRKKEIK